MTTPRTKNFNPKTDTKIRCTCGHPDCDQRSISQFTLNMLQNVRNDYHNPMIITSGGRCPNHPDQARKTNPNGGDHARGNGVDVAVSDRTDFNRLAVLAGRHGFNAIGDGLESGFIHLGYRPHKGKYVSSWDY